VSALKDRLSGRGTESAEAIDKRLKMALEEIKYAKEGAHEIVIVNDNVDRAYALLREVALGVKIFGDVLPSLDDDTQAGL
jgi:guanylate kinase